MVQVRGVKRVFVQRNGRVGGIFEQRAKPVLYTGCGLLSPLSPFISLVSAADTSTSVPAKLSGFPHRSRNRIDRHRAPLQATGHFPHELVFVLDGGVLHQDRHPWFTTPTFPFRVVER
jgi:hypothetical protein